MWYGYSAGYVSRLACIRGYVKNWVIDFQPFVTVSGSIQIHTAQ